MLKSRYNHDLAGRRTRVTWPGSYYVVADWDLANSPTKFRENGATTGAGVLASFTYDNLGRRVSLARANGAGASTTYGYDGMSRLSSLVHNASGTANDVTFGYSYNPASQITGRTVSNALYRWGVAADFSDAYTDNNLNQIATLDGAAFSHDARGNTTDDATKTYAYDADDRMTGAGTAAYAFDPQGRLYQETTSATTRFLYAGSQVIAEYDGANALQRRFVAGGLDEPLVWLEGTGTTNRKWLLADERGSIIAHANATAAISQINKYDPYGIAGAGVSGRFRYAGAPSLAAADNAGAALFKNEYDEYDRPAPANQGRFQYAGQQWLAELGHDYYRRRRTVAQFPFSPAPVRHCCAKDGTSSPLAAKIEACSIRAAFGPLMRISSSETVTSLTRV